MNTPAQATRSSNPEVARVIGRARDEIGLTAADIGKIMGIGQRQVQNWATGKGRPADRKRLRLLLDLQYVIDQLDDLFDADGAQLWLQARNRTLDGRRPFDMLVDGHADEVIAYLDRLADGNV